MATLMERITELYFKLIDRKDFVGQGGVAQPPIDLMEKQELDRKIEAGGNQLREEYRAAYIQPLRDSLKAGDFHTVLSKDKFSQSIVANAAIQPASNDELGNDVKRLQEVVVDIYKSFLASRRRLEIGLRLLQRLPPLVAFTAPSTEPPPQGPEVPASPFTVVVGKMKTISQEFKVGAVSLPAGYRKHPILWGALAHEVGGHGVLDADEALLPELKEKVGSLFRDRADPTLRLLWTHWCEEASSEVCAMLNLGPLYGLLSMLWLVVMTSLTASVSEREQSKELPKLSNQGFGRPLPQPGSLPGFLSLLEGLMRPTSKPADVNPINVIDQHPVFAIIPYVVIGAVGKLNDLKLETKTRYITQLEELARNLVGAPPNIEFPNLSVSVPNQDGKFNPLPPSLRFKKMEASARKVGAFIATVKLEALNGKNLQDLETWNNADENVAQIVAQQLLNGQPIVGIVQRDTPDTFDDARLLAGALFAVLRDPKRYDFINDALSQALGFSHQNERVLNPTASSLQIVPISNRRQHDVPTKTLPAKHEQQGMIRPSRAPTEIHAEG